jgi:hypothetical protein
MRIRAEYDIRTLIASGMLLLPSSFHSEPSQHHGLGGSRGGHANRICIVAPVPEVGQDRDTAVLKAGGMLTVSGSGVVGDGPALGTHSVIDGYSSMQA